MDLRAFGPRKYPESGLLLSSEGRGWDAISVELRAHPIGVVQPLVPPEVEINIAIRSQLDGTITRLGYGEYQQTAGTAGTVWLSPIGVENDVIEITSPLPETLHLYIPGRQFELLADDFNLPRSAGHSIQYITGADDDLIRQLGLSILSELERETAAGRMLVETASLMLAARLAQRYSDSRQANPPKDGRGRLDTIRLRRVLDFIDQNADRDFSVRDLADIACLSPFHFTRMFTAAMGMPPARFVSQQRLEKAKSLLAIGKLPLTEIALNARFSSQASFNRAFRRATGMTPGEYQRRTR